MTIPKHTRREFCAHAGQTLSLAAVATLITGCGGSPTSSSSNQLPEAPIITSTIVNNTITLTIDGSSPLNASGSGALINASGRNFLVSRSGASGFTALTAVCTHEQCNVTHYQNQVFECPCHGSQYSTSGAVIKGPANRSLQSFPTSFNNNVLTISV
jgi:cytochrome b6-f complex iron-sulfur subunit